MERHVKFLLVPALIFFCCCLQSSAQGSKGGNSRGRWGEWGTWSSCSKTCGYFGQQTRVRTWITAEGEPELEVPFTNTENADCVNLQECPVNGSWSAWNIWLPCNAACGEGKRRRERECNAPPPKNNGTDCKGAKFEEEDCDMDPCPETPVNFNMSLCTDDTAFMCKNEQMCVPKSQRCEGKVQCSDGSDEMECPKDRHRIGHVHFSSSASYGASASVMSILTVLVCVGLLPQRD